ncbi:MAG: transglutaminase domain-containing protein, partial [Phycisphaerae bacterium]
MNILRSIIGVVLFNVGLLAVPVSIDAAPLDPPDFDEQWYVVALQEPRTQEYRPCGHMYAVLQRVGREVHSKSTIKFEIRRADAVMKATAIQTSRETLDGRPLGFEHSLAFGMEPQTQTGIIQDGTLTLITKQYGVEKSRETYPFDPEIKFSWGLMRLQQEHGLEKGTKYTCKVYEPSLRPEGPLDVTLEVHGKEPIEILGKTRTLTRITTSMKLQAPKEGAAKPAVGGAAAMLGDITLDADNWVDDDFTPVVITLDMGVIKLRMYQTSKAEALKRGAPPEMFLNTLVSVEKPIGYGAREVRLRLRLKAGAKQRLPDLPDTAMQHVERVNDREAIVTIRRLDWKKIRKEVAASDVAESIQPYLEASTMCDTGDRKLRRLARRAVRGKETPAEKADALRKFVTDYITDKGMDVGFATASAVVRQRRGDCTEHGVLLAALARAAGLPARGVSGIIEVPSGALPGDG